MKCSVSLAAACSLLVLSPSVTQAHLAATGMGPIYDGIAHFTLSPEGFLPSLALAFFAGLRDSRHARCVFYSLPIAWFAGGVLALQEMAPSGVILSAFTAALFLVSGGLLASNLRLPVTIGFVSAVFLGLVRGFVDLTDVDTDRSPFLVLVGVCGSAAVVSGVASSVTLQLKRLWIIVAVRIYGSWVAALGLLLAGWTFR